MEISKEYMKEVCKIAQMENCCRYVLASAEGILCGKDDPTLKAALDKRVSKMVAKGDNCYGWDSYQRTCKS